MIDLYSLFELAQIKAIHSAIEPSLESIWRIKCRAYSEKFHTPLHVVMNDLDPSFILQSLYEDQYNPSIVDEELEELYETLSRIKDPTFVRISAQETEDLVDAVLNKEIKRASIKKAPTQEKITSEIKQAALKKPTSGGMDFSELEKLDSSTESRKAGFED
jgi:hypothetical protein